MVRARPEDDVQDQVCWLPGGQVAAYDEGQLAKPAELIFFPALEPRMVMYRKSF